MGPSLSRGAGEGQEAPFFEEGRNFPSPASRERVDRRVSAGTGEGRAASTLFGAGQDAAGSAFFPDK
jgi:hypothetical protein